MRNPRSEQAAFTKVDGKKSRYQDRPILTITQVPRARALQVSEDPAVRHARTPPARARPLSG